MRLGLNLVCPVIRYKTIAKSGDTCSATKVVRRRDSSDMGTTYLR